MSKITVLRKTTKADLERKFKLVEKNVRVDFWARKILNILVIIINVIIIIAIAFIFSILIRQEPTLDFMLFIIIFIATILSILGFIKVFNNYESIFEYCSRKVFFKFVTQKGNAILKKDFIKIKKCNPVIYYSIWTGLCNGYCYNVSLELLKMLKKGEVIILAVECIDMIKVVHKTVHAVYVNNGYVFDTFNQQQMLFEEWMSLNGATQEDMWKSFEYHQLENQTYEDFKNNYMPELYKWTTLRGVENDFKI